ncbi:hypothetical protein HDV04_005467 [Boothiomyces sp. JEL0838]|nr:hypothetical protein HDV04_005450 [Boothiomyces sp. JEL0838]KAJ3310044.1 hypothetical protein HDV04_005467 [Boothiomyces sp. JEL0838]
MEDRKEEPEKIPQKRKQSSKRAEQNRTAQKAFRQRKGEYMKQCEERIKILELERTGFISLIQENNQLLAKLEELKHENNNILQERERMIHIMDKLRSDNSILSSENTRLRKKIIKQTTQTYPNYGNIQRPVMTFGVKGGVGNFGAITRPPLVNANMEKRILPQWTSHSYTFVGKKEFNANSSDNLSELGSNISENKSKSSGTGTTAGTKESKIFSDSNNYPGFPTWTPTTDLRDTNTKSDYHLSFSYTDTPLAHTTLTQFLFDPIPEFNPFLPATLSMAPLCHHIPFESKPPTIPPEQLFELSNVFLPTKQ